jgi:hypothetical protein
MGSGCASAATRSSCSTATAVSRSTCTPDIRFLERLANPDAHRRGRGGVALLAAPMWSVLSCGRTAPALWLAVRARWCAAGVPPPSPSRPRRRCPRARPSHSGWRFLTGGPPASPSGRDGQSGIDLAEPPLHGSGRARRGGHIHGITIGDAGDASDPSVAKLASVRSCARKDPLARYGPRQPRRRVRPAAARRLPISSLESHVVLRPGPAEFPSGTERTSPRARWSERHS